MSVNPSIVPEDINFVFGGIRDLAGVEPGKATVLDFGCGRGHLVDGLSKLGVDAYGCDVDPYWEGDKPNLKAIDRSNYCIPYPDNTFDMVVSTSGT